MSLIAATAHDRKQLEQPAAHAGVLRKLTPFATTLLPYVLFMFSQRKSYIASPATRTGETMLSPDPEQSSNFIAMPLVRMGLIALFILASGGDGCAPNKHPPGGHFLTAQN